MTDEQREVLSNGLEDIQKALRQAKRALKDGHFTDLFSNLKAVHTATSKAKGQCIDHALANADGANAGGEDDE